MTTYKPVGVDENSLFPPRVETRLSNKFAPLVFTPEQYGAAGDGGVTDDTIPFGQAWNAAKNANGTLKLTKNYGVRSIPSARAGMSIIGGMAAPLYGSSPSNRPRITCLSGFTGSAALTNDGSVGGFITVYGVNWDASALGYGTTLKGWYAPGGGSHEPNWIVKESNFFDFGGSVDLGEISPIVVRCEGVSGFYGQSKDSFRINVYDSIFIDCLGQGSQYGWHILGAPATDFIVCRSEHNSQGGWFFDDAIVTSTTNLIGCSTDQNDGDGLIITGSTWGFTKGGSLNFTACRFGRDGNNSGAGSTTAAGIRLTNNAVPIHFSSTVASVARGDGTGYGPAYGLVATGNTGPITYSAGSLGGTVAPVSDDGTNTSLIITYDCTRYTYSTSGEVITYVPPTPPMKLVASTGPSGYTLVNGTGTVAEWTAPNDGKLHTVQIVASISVGGTNDAGGLIQDSITLPNYATIQENVFAADLGAYTASKKILGSVLGPGKRAAVQQNSALTAGGAVLWVEIWAS